MTYLPTFPQKMHQHVNIPVPWLVWDRLSSWIGTAFCQKCPFHHPKSSDMNSGQFRAIRNDDSGANAAVFQNCIARSTRRRCKEMLHCIYLLLHLHIEHHHILPRNHGVSRCIVCFRSPRGLASRHLLIHGPTAKLRETRLDFFTGRPIYDRRFHEPAGISTFIKLMGSPMKICFGPGGPVEFPEQLGQGCGAIHLGSQTGGVFHIYI